MNKYFLGAAMALSLSTSARSQPAGQFNGNAVLDFITAGHGRLQRSLSYRDPAGRLWAAPSGIVVDGASIPRPFWSLIGSPFTGDYLRASVIHDYYCDTKTRPWREVHRVFYDGMISGGVSELQAKIMYYAVYEFGPRWEMRTLSVPGHNFAGEPTMVQQTITLDVPRPEYNSDRVAAAQRRITETNPSLAEIEAMADAER